MTQTQQSVSKNLPQWKNDIAVVMRVAIGGRRYVLLPPTRYDDNRFTEKMQRQFNRVAKSVGLHLVFGTVQVSLRDAKANRFDKPILYTSDMIELAVVLLEEYRNRGGRTE